MKVHTKTLLQAIKKVMPAAGKKSALPICDCLHFKTENNSLILQATNLYKKFTEIVYLDETDKDIDIAVNIELFKKAIEGCGEFCFVDYKKSAGKITVSDETSRFEIPILPGEDFPGIEEKDEKKYEIVFSSSELKRLLSNTIFCVSNDDLKPQMCGLYFEISGNEIKVTGTDAHRLSHVVLSSRKNLEDNFAFLLDKEGADALSKILEDNESEIKATICNKVVNFSNNSGIFTCRLVQGKFPNYQFLLNEDNLKYSIEVKKAALTNALKKIFPFSSQETNLVKFTFSGDKLYLVAEDFNANASGSFCVDINNTNEESLKIGFNAKYFLEIINHVESEDILLLLESHGKACVVKNAVESESFTQKMIIMPIMLND